MRIIFFTLLLFLFTPVFFSQTQEINKTDAKGKKQGKWVKRDDKGLINYIGYFKDDNPIGVFRYYYPVKDSILKSVLIYSTDGKSVKVTNFHYTRTVMSSGKYLDKVKDSIWNFYNENGKLLISEQYLKGKLHGNRKVFYENGALLSECTYRGDKKDGEYKDFFESGQLKIKGIYKSNNPNGRFYMYYPNGQVMSEGNYVEGSKQNIWIEYKEDGSILKQETYNQGKLLNAKEAEEFLKKSKAEKLNKQKDNGKNSSSKKSGK